MPWTKRALISGLGVCIAASAKAHFIELIASVAKTAFTPGVGFRAFTLSNQNLTATSGTGGFCSVFALPAKTLGKWYVEVKISVMSTDTSFGIAASGFNTYDNPGADASSVGFYPVSPATSIYFNNVQLSGGSVSDTNGAVVRMAVDIGMQMIWFSSPAMVGAGNAWNNSSTANPATGVGGVSFSGITSGPYYILADSQESGNVFTLNTTAPFYGAIPTGFQPWN